MQTCCVCSIQGAARALATLSGTSVAAWQQLSALLGASPWISLILHGIGSVSASASQKGRCSTTPCLHLRRILYSLDL